MPHLFNPERAAFLISDERKKELNPDVILKKLPMKPENHIAEIGCGTGFFTVPLAKHLTKGKLIAMDIQPQMLEMAKARAAEAGVTNVEFAASQEFEFPAPKSSIDGAFIALVLHESEDRAMFLNKVKEILKPGGWVAIIEWVKEKTDGGPPVAERMSLSETIKEGRAAGLRYVSNESLNPKHYLVMLDKLAI